MVQRFQSCPSASFSGSWKTKRMRWVCGCGVSRGRAVSLPPTAPPGTTTIPSRPTYCLVQCPRGFSQYFGQCVLLSINGGEAIVLPTPHRGHMVGLGGQSVPCHVTYIAHWQTRTVAVPMRSFQSSVHGWPFVRHGVVAGFPPCEVNFAASKPPRWAGLSVFRSPVGRSLLPVGITSMRSAPTKSNHSRIVIVFA
jgi:hypothetical protein